MRPTLWAITILLVLSGCGRTPINKKLCHFDEPLRPADIEAFLDIAKSLPESKLLATIYPFQPPAKWDSDRTLPVRDLVSGDLQSLDERWQDSALGERPAQNKAVERALKRKHVSRERFASLAFAIGVACSLNSVPEDFDINRHLKRAQSVVLDLRKDGRVFNSLAPEVGHEVLGRAAWITEYHRGERLSHVPPYNAQLVKHYRDKLKDVLPSEFFACPYNTTLDRNASRALPFEDLPGNEGLETLTWDRTSAFKGSDDIEPRRRD